MALVDTGSDYDAIDHDLSLLQASQSNAAYISRTTKAAQTVRGFTAGVKQETTSVSYWVVTFSGPPVAQDPQIR